MRSAFIVRLPMGAGKTRLVLRKILHGVTGQLAGWNRRLRRTLIAGPNYHVHRAWLRELLLLALEQGLLEDTAEDAIREMSLGRLRRMLLRHDIVPPAYRTYRLLGRERVGSWHFLVLEEWHRVTAKIIGHCRRWVDKETGRRAWYVGGQNIKKDVFFVSATPVNPVLEEEEAVQEDAFDEEMFRERVAVALQRAGTILQGVTGRRATLRDQFFDFVEELRVKELGVHNLRWVLPKAVDGPVGDTTEDEHELVAKSLQEEVGWADEYARAVGLVRTIWDRHARVHRLSRSLTGRRKSFGKAYVTVHVVADGKGRPPAYRYLTEQHPRFRRLMEVLIKEAVVTKNGSGWQLTRAAKALVFCTHRGVALGLVETLNRMLGDDAADTNIDSDDVEGVTQSFNKRGAPPFILVGTDVLSEGIDLHWACKLLVQYELAWSPLRLFQRVGRLTRRKGKVGYNRNVRVAHVIVPGSVEEERVNRLLRRIEFLAEHGLWPTAATPLKLTRALLGSGPSLHLGEIVP